MRIFTLFLTFNFLLFSFLSVAQKQVTNKKSESLEWHTDIISANELAQASKKPLFAFFTGSDWCVWCKKLQADVFAKPEFIQWAKKNVILVELDFPRGKVLSPEQQQQNMSLQQTFGVQGYPTIWMFYMSKDSTGTKYNLHPLGSLGYPAGAEIGKEQVKFLQNANELLSKKSNYPNIAK